VFWRECGEVHAVVLDVGHAVVDELAHQIHGGVDLVDDQAANVATNVREVIDRENVLWLDDEERAGVLQKKRTIATDHVKRQQIAVYLGLHVFPVVHPSVQHIQYFQVLFVGLAY